MTFFRLFFSLFSVIGVSVFMVQSNASTQTPMQNSYSEALPKWQLVLESYVDEKGRVDFAGLSKDSANLELFVNAIGEVSPNANPELFDTQDKVLAYHANAYNALAMWGVIERKVPKNFSTLFKRASFFKFRKVKIGGKKTDLYTYENKVIRPLGDARMHFVLNCMVKDCPRLPQQAFRAESMQTTLQNAAIEFFTKEKHIQIDMENKTLRLSGIMKFYTKDYVASGKKQDLLEYVNRFRTEKIPSDYKVLFIKYDWTVNKQP